MDALVKKGVPRYGKIRAHSFLLPSLEHFPPVSLDQVVASHSECYRMDGIKLSALSCGVYWVDVVLRLDLAVTYSVLIRTVPDRDEEGDGDAVCFGESM